MALVVGGGWRVRVHQEMPSLAAGGSVAGLVSAERFGGELLAISCGRVAGAPGWPARLCAGLAGVGVGTAARGGGQGHAPERRFPILRGGALDAFWPQSIQLHQQLGTATQLMEELCS